MFACVFSWKQFGAVGALEQRKSTFGFTFLTSYFAYHYFLFTYLFIFGFERQGFLYVALTVLDSLCRSGWPGTPAVFIFSLLSIVIGDMDHWLQFIFWSNELIKKIFLGKRVKFSHGGWTCKLNDRKILRKMRTHVWERRFLKRLGCSLLPSLMLLGIIYPEICSCTLLIFTVVLSILWWKMS